MNSPWTRLRALDSIVWACLPALVVPCLGACQAETSAGAADPASPAAPSAPPEESAGGAESPSASPGAAGARAIDSKGELLVDDLDSPDGKFVFRGVAGEWFTYADGTAPVSPPDHGGIGDTPGEVHVTGEGFTDWGVGLAAYFQYSDVSDFKGVKVRVKGTGTVRLEVSIPATLPLDHGGTCTSDCYGHYHTFIRLPAEYEDITVLFSELRQGGGEPVELDLHKVGQVDFRVSPEGGVPATVDFWVDRLSFVGAAPSGESL